MLHDCPQLWPASQPQWRAHAAVALFLIMCSVAHVAGTPPDSHAGPHGLSPGTSPSGLMDEAGPQLAPDTAGNKTHTGAAMWGNRSLTGAASPHAAGDTGWQRYADPVVGGHDSSSAQPHGDSGSTASLELPISFPEGWLAEQASELLAFSLHALQQQEADEQVP